MRPGARPLPSQLPTPLSPFPSLLYPEGAPQVRCAPPSWPLFLPYLRPAPPPHLPGPPPPPTEAPAKARQDPVHKQRAGDSNLGAVSPTSSLAGGRGRGFCVPRFGCSAPGPAETPSGSRTGASGGDPTQAQARLLRRLK